jgi:ribosomal protein S18 acetylase RimI-like enzyme
MSPANFQPITLRPYRPKDLEDCMTIWRKASLAGHPFLSPTEIEADEPLVRDQYMPMAEITVASLDSCVVGFIAMLGDVVGGLFVAPEQHRLGIGRALIAFEAKRRGRMTVEVYEENTKARAFYRASGFVETGRRNTDDRGRPHPLVGMDMAAGSTARDR